MDTCVIEEEIGFLRSGLSRVIGEIGGECFVGLITFGRYVCVHELGFFGRKNKVYVFNGGKEISKDQILEQMGFFLKKPRPATGVVAGVKRWAFA
ncbi:putative protein transport protein Sec23 [Helianthus annuus]|uniref:Protein transport protein SEC23 n=1 Tax=Helianthus annuus TaxID=4232 RepID=A0A9K3HGN3_HELAN|nr:putative protein transport protein Sec23 [Helianthus annuus]KAJ0489393.1 putative protein transport protein Sec23 [Helianthus annuus]KAJ0493193.1 putative protein transport protein Sec23 [Helianthus annuus]KAJ0505274.1 putative protein transport protein Sec23 [Helianthus annuus]KAJ0674956.1 putative protein transport protein Sec23 [Helianthus annuus]